jgi:hypothetical protein
MPSLALLLATAFLLTAAAAAPDAAAAAQQPHHRSLTISSAQHMRVLAQAAPATANGPPGSAGGAAGGAPGAPPGPPPNSTQLAGIIIGSFNASADTTPQVCCLCTADVLVVF